MEEQEPIKRLHSTLSPDCDSIEQGNKKANKKEAKQGKESKENITHNIQ